MKSIFLLCLALLLVYCSDDKNNTANTCSVLIPTQQLRWLKEAIEEHQKSDFVDFTVEQGEYFSQTVFIITPCCPTCNFMPPPVYTCEGEEIEGLDSYDEKIRERKVIWKTPADGAECW